ncbi:DUF4760 domain-containing protein [Acinetobacter baumannii]|uniref:DUF4760 domain-containing protein n=2 Tax=Acinetobacter baumannii TaxID=470 RepID=UPI0002AEC916|nr:DUF4760 domain-containing protein [Acinetobacter baumannii]AHB92179.1 hypothetical protein P795_12270 [Acinetobacter baumannii ZW85-1]ELW90994.1 hypothetical protein ACINAA014_1077 [Acinetobacter baumannii AA-014]KKI95574.1 hypothetical protein WQ50_12415 [Acinetobacter baumannii]MBD0076410.1 DUF4760 domain-containing protein [Acinetobacter baumannii]MBD0087846.1 DUF4760 domain-containing protein [Acinetobacter baumannii]
MTTFLLNCLLILPYLIISGYFFFKVRDSYFYKSRSSVQLLYVFLLLTTVIFELLIWKGFFEEYNFLNISLVKEVNDSYYFQQHTIFGLLSEAPAGSGKLTSFVAFLSAIAAIAGWIFTSRLQIINATKTHAMQVLMNSRTSTAYVAKVDDAMKLRAKVKEDNGWTEKDRIYVSKERYLKLQPEERSAVHYLLNFLEFIAVGIRHNNLDEEMLKGSFKTILTNNYLLFHPIILHIREQTPSNYTELEVLFLRWDQGEHQTCLKCEEWYKTKELDKNSKRCKTCLES